MATALLEIKPENFLKQKQIKDFLDIAPFDQYYDLYNFIMQVTGESTIKEAFAAMDDMTVNQVYAEMQNVMEME